MFSISVKNFKSLVDFDWSPRSSNLVIGPSGSGKSTIAEVLMFMRSLFLLGRESAFASFSGISFLKTAGSEDDSPVEITITVPNNGISEHYFVWKVSFKIKKHGKLLPCYSDFNEELTMDGYSVPLSAFREPENRSLARAALDFGNDERLNHLLFFIEGMGVYGVSGVETIKDSSSHSHNGSDRVLHRYGRNLWCLLSRWNDSPTLHMNKLGQIIELMESVLKDPPISIEFDRWTPYFIMRSRPSHCLSSDVISAGTMSCLFCLTAVVNADPGSVLMIDNVGNQMDDESTENLVARILEVSERKKLTVILTTHHTKNIPLLFKQDEVLDMGRTKGIVW